MNINDKGLTSKDFFKKIINDIQEIFHELIRWSPEQCERFKVLVDALEDSENTTKESGDKLERLVDFIIRNSYFFDMYGNIRTQTNEIDEVIVLSKQGKIALHTFNLPRTLLPWDKDIIIGECKNYSEKLGVTYIGKFYSLMKATDVSFGILFTKNGLTGKSDGYADGYGLLKVLRLVENSARSDKEFYMIAFNLKDYRDMASGTSFFEIVEAKKKELQLASKYGSFIQNHSHEAADDVNELISTYTKVNKETLKN